MAKEQLIDKTNRVINYLRLSITDRCNLRCTYCMPEEGINFLPHSEILTYEEMLHLVRLSVEAGIRKVRLTGGEPLVRKGFIPFLESLCRIEALKEITLTTNGVLLKELAADIKACGISRINISLDSLKAERFFQITGRDYFDRVWEGIQEAERLEFDPIKINVVVMKGINDEEILDFARLTLEKPYHIRFIEFMPVGANNGWSPKKFISMEEIREQIGTLGVLRPVKSNPLDGPAQRYVLERAKGEIGFIGALSNHFCEKCNRLRITAEGHLRGCLFSDQEIDIKSPLREGKGDAHLFDLISDAMKNKPREPGAGRHGPRKCIRQMSSIGG
ncbi:MAG: GTP 3',8-cyclase MoaA [Desulfobacteraceae bacterium]|uniref:GTP 3',8-cyclase n=1 Tax=Candidatus Desulfacyla euxinica TaxID=2841693 RepID=A0A8J6N1C7_9DELT|nr:GTP 3',8-cyclase MoaA [Candidatus Desulfacyla euxinica]MBL6978155.1 GTP 3',8-cyclase MoaA [Desulfobacteraceae bacterium]